MDALPLPPPSNLSNLNKTYLLLELGKESNPFIIPIISGVFFRAISPKSLAINSRFINQSLKRNIHLKLIKWKFQGMQNWN